MLQNQLLLIKWINSKANGLYNDIGSVAPSGKIRRHLKLYLSDPRKATGNDADGSQTSGKIILGGNNYGYHNCHFREYR